MARFCADCPKQITPASKTGRCRSCALRFLSQDPEFQAKRAAASAAASRRPEVRFKMGRGVARAYRERIASDPAFAATMRENMRRIQWEHRNTRPAGADSRVRAGQSIREHYLGWCPPEYRAQYRWLMRTKRLTSAQAKESIQADIRRAKEQMSPFERQEQALRNGATFYDAAAPR